MRYLLLTYYRKPNGQVDEAMSVARRIKQNDLQTANVILDFRDLKVIKASMGSTQVPRDWDRIVSYYHQHYASTIERLLKENGYEIFYFPCGYGKQIEKDSFYCKLINDKGGKMLKFDRQFKNRINTYRGKTYTVRKKCDFVLGEEVNIVVDNEIISQAKIVKIDKFDNYQFYHKRMSVGEINQGLYFKYKDKDIFRINSYYYDDRSNFKALGFDIVNTTKKYFDSEYIIHNADGMKEYYDNYFKGDKSGYLIKFALTRCY